MQRNIYLSIAVAALMCAPVFGCSEDITGPAHLTLEEGENLPCLGVKRFMVIVTDGQSEKIFDNFGDFFFTTRKVTASCRSTCSPYSTG